MIHDTNRDARISVIAVCPRNLVHLHTYNYGQDFLDMQYYNNCLRIFFLQRSAV